MYRYLRLRTHVSFRKTKAQSNKAQRNDYVLIYPHSHEKAVILPRDNAHEDEIFIYGEVHTCDIR